MTAQHVPIHPTASPELMTTPPASPEQEADTKSPLGSLGDQDKGTMESIDNDVTAQVSSSLQSGVKTDLGSTVLAGSDNSETRRDEETGKLENSRKARGRRRSKSSGRKKSRMSLSTDKKKKKKKKDSTGEPEVSKSVDGNEDQPTEEGAKKASENVETSAPGKERKVKKKRKKLKASKSDGALKAAMKTQLRQEEKEKNTESSTADNDSSPNSQEATMELVPSESVDDNEVKELVPSRPSTPEPEVESMAPIRISTQKPPRQRSNSFTSPLSANERKKLVANAKSLNANGLLHWTDGRRLQHWDRANFELKRSKKSSQVRYGPKEGEEYYKRVLNKEEDSVLRRDMSEQPHLSKYNRMFPTVGHFCCKACGKAIYSYKSKINTFDGWPGFGSCVSGAIELITAEQLKQQEQKKTRAAIRIQKVFRGRDCRRNIAAMHIQRVFRGGLWRGRVSRALEIVIEKMMAKSEGTEPACADEPRFIDVMADIIKEAELARGSAIADPESIGDNLATGGADIVNKPVAPVTNQDEKDDLGDVVSASQVTSGEYNELRCMRCKSHLGNVISEKNFGKAGQLYYERHRVNGKALKYVDDELPKKRVQEEEPLLPVEKSTQNRNSGLLAKVNALKKALPPSRAGTFTMTKSEAAKQRKCTGRRLDPLSQSCHQPKSPNMISKPPLRRNGSSDPPLRLMRSSVDSRRSSSTDPSFRDSRRAASTNQLPPIPTGRRAKDPLSQSDHNSDGSKYSFGMPRRGRRPKDPLSQSGHNPIAAKFSSGQTTSEGKTTWVIPKNDPLGSSDHGVWTTPGQIHGLPTLRKTGRNREDTLSTSNHG